MAIDQKLSELLGKRVTEIEGYLSSEFGDPVFKIVQIVFEDGSKLWAEGEHDMPYIPVPDNETVHQRLKEMEND